MANSTVVEELKAACKQGLEMDVSRLISRAEDWGRINFEGAKNSLQTATFLFDAFSTLPVDILPNQDVSGLRDNARAVVQHMQAIDKFNIAIENPSNQAAALTSNLVQHVDAFQRASFNLLPYLAYHRGDIQAKLAAIEGAVDKAEKLYDSGKHSIDEKAKLLDDALAAARVAAAKAGAAVFTQDFFTEADTLNTAATNWLRAATGLAAAALIVAVAMLWLHPPVEASTPYLLQYTVTKLVVIGGLITGAIWCGSIYRALRHQIVVNRHRGNALKTFQAFTEAAGDNQDVRNAVLLETTRSIFAVVPSGFLNATETNAEGGLKAADVAKTLGKG